LEALEQGEARFQELIMHSVNGILVVDQAGIVQIANPSALAIFGRDAAALVGAPCPLPLVMAQK
jgi:PAS domain S-box-containing protein